MTDRATPDTRLTLSEVADAGRRSRGNPEKWSDPGRQQRFLDALREGYSIGGACVQAGWAYNSWRQWASEAEQADARGERCKYSDLHDAYREAVRDGDRLLYATVHTAAMHGDVKAATWILERRTSRTWAKATEVEVSGPDGGAIQVQGLTVDTLKNASDDELRALSARRNREPA